MIVYITEMAAAEVEQVFQWLAERSILAANRWKSQLLQSIKRLEDFAESYPLAPEADTLGFELRQLLHGKRMNKYRVLFEIRGDKVFVLRVRHGAQEFLDRSSW